MISWSDIDAEVEEFQSGYRSGFVAIFKKYEGVETDERDGANRAVKVSQSSFARRYGIGETTFKRWLKEEASGPGPDRSGSNSVTRKIQEAATKAKAEAEAKAATTLAAALARQKAESESLAREIAETAERAKQAAVEAERKRVEATAKAKAEAEAQAKLEKITEQIRAEIKAEPPTPEVLAEMAKRALTSSDPDIVSRMAEAYGKHRVEQDARNQQDARARAAASRAQQAERDANNAARRASQEFEDSALKLFLDAYDLLKDTNLLLSRKPITFSNVVASGLTAGEVEDRVEEAIEFIKRVEASVLDATMENVQSS